jgi:hypothetical protein
LKVNLYPAAALAFTIIFILLFWTVPASGQCKEKISESNYQKVHYHQIKLSDKGEYLTLSRTGNERLFAYNNEVWDLTYHVRMFTEIKFISGSGNFSLYTAKSERTPWQTCMTLSTPLTKKEIQLMKGTSRIEVILPEEKRVFVFNESGNKLLLKALACLY